MSAHYGGSHYASNHYLSNHYGRTVVIPPEPEQVHPMGSDPRAAALRARILREDEEILAVIMAFMQTKDD
jgi:hypothetical protein